jgi:aspartate aminotransferase
MKPLSKVACAITPSATLALNNLYKEMKADGIDVIGFTCGEPDFPTPDNINMAAVKAIVDHDTKYTPAGGTMALKKAICGRLQEDLGVSYKPNQIVVTSGAKHCLYIALQALVNPGEEVILPAPYWVSYLELIKMVGGVPVVVSASEAEDFKITPEKLEAAITPKTKALMLNNPSNPTGMVYTKEELEALVAVCVKHDLYIISDEIYYKLIYGDVTFTSVAALGQEAYDHTILINGVSKSYAMTGWRIGYIAASAEIAKVCSSYLSHSTGNPNSIAQAASVEALAGQQDTVEAMRVQFEKRRDYMVSEMNKIEGISCLNPQGAFYVMMNISQLVGKTIKGRVIHNADDFADVFLKEGLVCVVPCTSFGDDMFLRWSYATSMEDIVEGIKRLKALVEG